MASLDSVSRLAFYPNLDADDELGSNGPYQPSKEVKSGITARRTALVDWAGADDVLEFERPARFEPLRWDAALCWCPTRRALRVLERAGWPLPRAPTPAVLQRVNDRRFVLSRAPAELERTWVSPGGDLAWAASGGRFRLKRPFGFAGRGQRTVGPDLSADDRRWLEDSLAVGFVRERACEVVEEWSLHGLVVGERVLLGAPCRQSVDRFGSPTGFERLPGVCAFEGELLTTAREVASELKAQGYFGPFGIDAFSYRASGAVRFNPLSDLNARFTLAWSLGMGERRAEALGCLAKGRAG